MSSDTKIVDNAIREAIEDRLKNLDERIKKEQLARERHAKRMRNIKEAAETEEAIERWRFNKYQD